MVKCNQLIMTFLVVILILAGTTTTSAAPNIVINPSAVHSGESISITGSGFTPGTTVTIIPDGLGTISGNLNPTVLGDGTFSTSIVILGGPQPPAAGIHTIKATTATESAEATFEVLPGEIGVVPSTGPPGTKIEIQGNNLLYDAGDLIYDAYFDNIKIGRVEHTGHKLFNYPGDDLFIPVNATPGFHKIKVGAAYENLETDFCVVTKEVPDACGISVPEFPTITVQIATIISLLFAVFLIKKK